MKRGHKILLQHRPVFGACENHLVSGTKLTTRKVDEVIRVVCRETSHAQGDADE